uniref:Uncharacterized protein n=1 Tax=Oryza meridionalis TaxID=40149 RepID=A0A0E0ELQ3_9ORYZ
MVLVFSPSRPPQAANGSGDRTDGRQGRRRRPPIGSRPGEGGSQKAKGEGKRQQQQHQPQPCGG